MEATDEIRWVLTSSCRIGAHGECCGESIATSTNLVDGRPWSCRNLCACDCHVEDDDDRTAPTGDGPPPHDAATATGMYDG